MKKLIANEWYKFFKSRKNRVLILCLFLANIAMVGYNYVLSTTYMSETSQIYIDRGGFSEKMSASLLEILESEDMTYETSEDILKQRIEFYAILGRNQLSAGFFYGEDHEKDYDFINISLNKIYTSMLEAVENGVITEQMVKERGYSLRDLRQLADYTDYLSTYEPSLLLNTKTVNGTNGMVQFLSSLNLIVVVALLAFLMMDIYLKEVTEGSYKLAFTQPEERKRLFWAKSISVISIGLLLTLVTAFLVFLVSTAIGGPGNLNYPMMSKESLLYFTTSGMEAKMAILPAWQYVVMGMGMLLSLIVLTATLILAVSIKTDSNNATISAVVILLFLAFAMGSFLSATSPVHLWYPYAYLFVEKVLSVTNRANYFIGIALNLGFSGIFLLYSYRTFIRKDFLGAVD